MNESSELLESFCTSHARVRAERGGDGAHPARAPAPASTTAAAAATAATGTPLKFRSHFKVLPTLVYTVHRPVRAPPLMIGLRDPASPVQLSALPRILIPNYTLPIFYTPIIQYIYYKIYFICRKFII